MRFTALLLVALALTIGGLAPGAAAPAQMPPAELARLLRAKEPVVLVNVHVPYDGEIAGTETFVPFNAIGKNLARLPGGRDTTVVLYCRGGRMSDIAAETLAQLGYTKVWSLEGGMAAWELAGYPVARRSR